MWVQLPRSLCPADALRRHAALGMVQCPAVCYLASIGADLQERATLLTMVARFHGKPRLEEGDAPSRSCSLCECRTHNLWMPSSDLPTEDHELRTTAREDRARNRCTPQQLWQQGVYA